MFMTWGRRLRLWRARVGPLWWYSGWLFVAGRFGDLLNLYLGVIFLPRALSPNDLGSVEPLMRLAGFPVIPISVLSMVGAQYISAYHAHGERGKIKRLLRDMGLLAIGSSLVFGAVLGLGSEALGVRLSLESRVILPAVIVLGALTAGEAVLRVMLQGMQRFYTGIVGGLANPALRLVLAACLVPVLGLGGYLMAAAVSVAAALAVAAFGLREFLGREFRSASYYAEWRDILRMAIPVGLGVLAISLQGFVEPLTVKRWFPPEDAAGYYMACRFGYIPMYLVTPMSFVLLPLLAHRHAKGESTTGYLVSAYTVTLVIGLVGVLGLWLFGDRLLSLHAAWRAYRPYGRYMGMIGLMVTMDALIQIRATHGIARRELGYLRVVVPVTLLDCVVLYVSLGWGFFRGMVPSALWHALEAAIPRTLGYVVMVMVLSRAITLLLLSAQGWRSAGRRNAASESGCASPPVKGAI